MTSAFMNNMQMVPTAVNHDEVCQKLLWAYVPMIDKPGHVPKHCCILIRKKQSFRGTIITFHKISTATVVFSYYPRERGTILYPREATLLK